MAHDTEKLRKLLGRVEKATEPDRMLDAKVYVALAPGAVSPSSVPGLVHEHGYGSYRVNEFTASLDASIALVERMLPGRGWSVESYGLTCLGEIICDDEVDASSVGPTPPLAILSALLRALILQAEGESA